MAKRTIVGPEARVEKKAEVFEEMENHEDIRGKVAAHKRALQKYEEKTQILHPIELIAQDQLFIRNVKYSGADEDYPHEHQGLFRFVSKIYPNAKGGPLYVDEPKNPNEIHRAWDRHEKMVARNLRHVIFEKDTSYEHLLEQLGEL